MQAMVVVMEEHRHLDLIKQELKGKNLLQHQLQREAVDCLSEIAKDKNKKEMERWSHKRHQEKLKVLLIEERTEVI